MEKPSQIEGTDTEICCPYLTHQIPRRNMQVKVFAQKVKGSEKHNPAGWLACSE